MKYLPSYILIIFFTPLFACHVSSSSKDKPALKTEAVTQKPGINFIEQDWNQALKTAHDKNKLVFIDICATWCGPCKMLKQYTFTDSAVGIFFNENFVNVSIDGEKGVGPELAHQYAIEGYPTLIVADATGKPVLLTAGYLPADVLLKFANEALKRSGQSKM